MKLHLSRLHALSVCTLCVAGTLIVSAQTAPKPAAQTSAQAKSGTFTVPRLKSGRPDFQGMWAGVRRGGDTSGPFENMKYLPSALPIKDDLYRRGGNDMLHFWCATASIPASLIYHPFPIMVFQDGENVVLLHEYAHDVRVIPTDNSQHPPLSVFSGMNGDSRGRWEGDTLVVDTTNFAKGNRRMNMKGDFIDENTHLIERFTLIAQDQLRYESTVTDPTVLSEPWSTSDVLRRRPKDDWILDTACREGEQDAAALAAAGAALN